jgi:uncharacterized protein YbjT (DUF2867 family)
MKNAIIVGASGLVGGALVSELVAANAYNMVYVLVRKKLPINNAKLTQLVVDFDNIDPSIFNNIDDVFCSLGTTIKVAGSKAAFRKVDLEYPIKIAELALKAGAKQFLVVSAMGANTKSMVFYNQVKGEMESTLAKMPFNAVIVFRPSLLLGKRQTARGGEQIATIFMKAFSFLIPANYKAIHVNQVARAMHQKAQEQLNGLVIVENKMMLGKV